LFRHADCYFESIEIALCALCETTRSSVSGMTVERPKNPSSMESDITINTIVMRGFIGYG
jgi:hypothetical protein